MAHRGGGTGARWAGARSVPATAAMPDIEPSQDCTVPEPGLATRAGRYLGLLLDHRNGRRVGMATRPAHKPVDELGRRRRSVVVGSMVSTDSASTVMAAPRVRRRPDDVAEDVARLADRLRHVSTHDRLALPRGSARGWHGRGCAGPRFAVVRPYDQIWQGVEALSCGLIPMLGHPACDVHCWQLGL